MNAPDPYAQIEQLCHVSSSQEELLRRCRFANEPPAADNPKPSQETEDNGVVCPVESEGIVMVSLPETPPEEGIPGAEATSRNSESLEGAVDLGRDTDWVFTSGAEWTEREIRVSGGGLGLDSEACGELGNSVSCSFSQSKRLKLGVEDRRRREDLGKSMEEPNREGIGVGDQSKRLKLGVEERRRGEDLGKSVEEPNREGIGIGDQSKRLKLGVEERRRKEDLGKSVEEPNREGIGVGEVRGERYLKRKEVGVSEPGLGFSNRSGGVRQSIDDIDKFRYVGCGGVGSSRKEMGASGKRTLPAWIRGWTDGGACGGELKEVNLLDVLKMLGEGSSNDHSVKNLSVLEAAKRRGMTFP